MGLKRAIGVLGGADHDFADYAPARQHALSGEGLNQAICSPGQPAGEAKDNERHLVAGCANCVLCALGLQARGAALRGSIAVQDVFGPGAVQDKAGMGEIDQALARQLDDHMPGITAHAHNRTMPLQPLAG